MFNISMGVHKQSLIISSYKHHLWLQWQCAVTSQRLGFLKWILTLSFTHCYMILTHTAAQSFLFHRVPKIMKSIREPWNLSQHRFEKPCSQTPCQVILLLCTTFDFDRASDTNRACLIYPRDLCSISSYPKDVTYHHPWSCRVERTGEEDVLCHSQLGSLLAAKRKLLDALWTIS